MIGKIDRTKRRDKVVRAARGMKPFTRGVAGAGGIVVRRRGRRGYRAEVKVEPEPWPPGCACVPGRRPAPLTPDGRAGLFHQVAATRHTGTPFNVTVSQLLVSPDATAAAPKAVSVRGAL
jgi:hypothetical protein